MQNFWPSMNLKEQHDLVRGNRPRTSYNGRTDLICGIHLDRIMKACSNEGPFSIRTWETGELRSPDKVIGNKRHTDLDHRSCPGV
jgi:hypothetical protein